MRCTSCKEFGHNKRTCQGAIVGSVGRSKGKNGQNASWYMFGFKKLVVRICILMEDCLVNILCFNLEQK